MLRHTLTWTALLAPAFATPAQAIDLYGPPLQAGDTYQVATHTTTEPGNLTMSMFDQKMTGESQVNNNNTILVEILETEDGQPTHVNQTFIENRSITTLTLDGQPAQEQKQGQELEGMVLDQRLTEDGWVTQIGGIAVPPEVEDILANTQFVAPNVLYPTDPVEIGDSWIVDGAELAALLAATGIPGATAAGEGVFELVEIQDIDGVSTAIIAYDMDVAMSFDMKIEGAGFEMHIEMVGKGMIHRRLDRYIDTNTFEGTMGFTMQAEHEGQVMMQMESEMPVTNHTHQSIPDENQDAE